MSPQKIHDLFLEIATGLSARLHDAMQAVGPVRLHPQRALSLAEKLSRTVAGQQLSTKAASTIWGRVVEHAGETPLIQHLTSVPADSLRGCGLSHSKVRTIKEISAAHNAGLLNTEEFSRMNHTARSSRLTAIRGIGPWTADMIGIFYFADKDVWPDTDLTVWKTLERLTSKRRKTSRTAARFAPYRSFLALYMYRIADMK